MKYIFLLLFLLISSVSISQQIVARIIDKNTKNPIPYATIKTGEYSGVISNEDGYFTINEKNDSQAIIISCMGYASETLTVQQIKDFRFVIPLSEAINQLNDVYISNKRPNVDSIIARVKKNVNINYNTELYKYNLFKRSTEYVDFKSLDFEIDKASHVSYKKIDKANKDLAELGKQIMESNIKSFSDFKGTLYTLNKDSCKINVEKATKLLDHKNDFSIDNIEEKGKSIVLNYLDTTKTYKFKTGIFKIEDSLSLNNEEFKNDKKLEYTLNSLSKSTYRLLKRSQFHKDAFMNTLLDTDYYEYEFKDIFSNNGVLTYIIDFKPKKGKAKYSGSLYITDNSYAITRVDYKYYKNRHGGKFNLKLLFGIKYIEDISEGAIIYEKDSSNIYQPKYIKHLTGSYFYVSRELKFIENSINRYKILFDFTLEGDQREQEELLISTNNKITESDFASIYQAKNVPIQVLSNYKKTLWQNEAIIEPTLEMKDFEVRGD